MADYRLILRLLLERHSYRHIEARAACSHRAIAKAKRVLDDEQFTTPAQIDQLTAEDLDRLFVDKRKGVSTVFVPIDVDSVVAARLGRHKPPLKVLWARYLHTPAVPDAKFYGYDRFCEIATEHVRVRDLTAAIQHIPGHTMQVDWAGTKMSLVDPVTRHETPVSVFVASLPFSGLVFAYGYLDEKQAAWCDAHRRAFEYFGGVASVIVPDNASTASNQISRSERARDVNATYSAFLEHYQTAAVPTKERSPRHKGHVESGVKVVTNWVIHFLADRVFTSLDELNEAVGEQIEIINHRTPFRGEPRSRYDWFTELEQQELLDLPEQRWEPVVWRKAKVHRDWHIQIDTIKYSVPYKYAGLSVDVRIVGDTISVLNAGEIIATHMRGPRKNGYVTDAEHAPAYLEETTGLWTRAYFLRQAAKIGPGCVNALTRLLDGRKIEAQGFRSCMNILELGKRGNRFLLKQACQTIIADEYRQISYTAVKQHLTRIRAEQDSRPHAPGTRTPQASSQALPERSANRDTSRAHLAGAEAFSLENLLSQQGTRNEGENDA